MLVLLVLKILGPLPDQARTCACMHTDYNTASLPVHLWFVWSCCCHLQACDLAFEALLLSKLLYASALDLMGKWLWAADFITATSDTNRTK